MKRYLKILIIVLLVIVSVGCKNNKKDDTESKHEEVIKKLYSDDDKLVFKNGDYYKLVFYYNDNEITGEEQIYEYESNEVANEKYEANKLLVANSNEIESMDVVDNYIIYTMKKDQYEGLTVDNIIEKYSFLEEIEK